MKIAMVSGQASPLARDLGQSAHVGGLAAAMTALGHEVTVYTRRDEPKSPERVRTGDGYEVVRVCAGPAAELTDDEVVAHLGDFAGFLAARWRLRAPDVVHAHHWTSGLAAVLGAHRLQVPVVQSYHGLAAHDAPQRSDAEALVARKAAWTVATSSAEAVRLQTLGVRRTRISTVPCGVDLELFHPDGPATARGRFKRVVTAADPRSRNGFDELITTLSATDDVELVVIGEDARTRWQGRARELGVADRVVFAGAVPRTGRPALLRSADAVVCTPPAEPFGILALEAMACGVPVVATAVGALADVVVPDVTGLLVAPHDLRALIRALRRSLGDETLRQEFGSAARDRMAARYPTARLAAEMVTVYEQANPVAVNRGACVRTA